MPGKTSSLRTGIWTGDSAHPREIGELARDIDARFASIVGQYRSLELPGFTYTPPILIDNGGITPKALLVGQVRTPGNPTNTVISTQPIWDTLGAMVRINSIGGLTVGVKYDMTLLIFG